MSITLEVDGTEFNNFTRASATISLAQFVNTFSFGATSDVPQKFPVTVGASVRVLIDNTPIITGFIEGINGNHNATGRSIDIQGVSKTVDVIDTTADQASFATPVKITFLFEKILRQAGISGISVTNEVDLGDDEFFTEDELIKIDQGQSVYSVLEQYARKRQVFLVTNGDGNIVITKNSGVKNNFKLLSRFDDNDNNVISANVIMDNKDRYNKYIVVSQTNMAGINILDDDPGAEQASNQRGEAIDEDIRSNRTFIFTAENASDNVNLIERAKWEANVRRALSLTYNASVSGHFQKKNEPWQLNQIITVIDDFEAINAPMLIDQITFNESLNAGNTTEIRCVKPDSYTQEASETDKQKKVTEFPPVFTEGIGIPDRLGLPERFIRTRTL